MLTSIAQMEANIAKFKHDIELDDKKYKLEFWKIGVSLIVGAAACVGAGAALMNYVDRHDPSITHSYQVKP